MYTPVNLSVYVAGFVGALEGLAANRGVNVALAPGVQQVAGAFAQQLDTNWGSTITSQLDLDNMGAQAAAFFEQRGDIQSQGAKVPATYTGVADQVINTVLNARTYFGSQGIVPPPIAPTGGATAFAILRPGAPSAAPAYATIAEIAPLVAAADGAFTLYVDSSIAPAHVTQDLDGQDRIVFAPALGPIGGVPMTLTIDDGFQLQKVFAVRGQLRIEAAPTIRTPFTPSSQGVILDNGAQLILRSGATMPFISIDAGEICAFVVSFSSQFLTVAAGVPFASNEGVFSNFYVELSPFSQPQNNTVSGAGSILYVYDASVKLPTQGFFSGSITTFPMVKGQVNRATIEFTLAQLQAFGPGFSLSAVIPPFNSGAIANAQICGPIDIELRETFAAPGLLSAELQAVADGGAYGLVPLTGVATGLGAPGWVGSYAAVQHGDMNTPELPQLQIILTGALFQDLTAGSIRATFPYAIVP